tara:strand:+ start:117 stop:452 length:336 start_codon:yes stop_codon:yes gene_type:complete
MNKSPLNFLSGLAAGLVSSQSNKKNAGKVKQRVSKLENQMKAIQQEENQQGSVPTFQTSVQGDLADNMIQTQPEDDLLSLSPQLGGPEAVATGNQMFGSEIPGSFDKNMGL